MQATIGIDGKQQFIYLCIYITYLAFYKIEKRAVLEKKLSENLF